MSVDAEQLLKELREAWAQTGSQDQAGHGVLRACSMTVMVLTGADDDPQQLGETLAELMHSHPSRTIVLRLEPAGHELEGQAVIQCWMPFGRRQQICCEQIELRCPEDRMAGAHSAVLGLLVPDLPVNLWLRDPRWLEMPDSGALLRLASKVILDRAHTSFPALPFAAADLAWCRLTRWRETIAQLVPAGKEQITGVEIAHAGADRPRTAIYMAAWLRAELGPEAGIRLVQEPGPLPRKGVGRIRAVRLTGPSLRASLVRATDTEVVVDCGRICTRVVFPVFTDLMLLQEELTVLGRDAAYERTLAAVPEFEAAQ